MATKKKTETPRTLLDKAYKMLNSGARMPDKFMKAETVAIMAGPAIVIEAIVAKAESDSGIKMDWCYQGGRAFIQALGNRKKARAALYGASPQSDLTQIDL